MSSKINANNSVDGVSISADSSGILELQTKGVTAITIDDSQNVTIPFKQTGTGAVARTLDAKAKETVSVLDFGAVGDGVTDDTAAIQAAINTASGRNLWFPLTNASYVINSVLIQPTIPTSFIIDGGVIFSGTGRLPSALSNGAQDNKGVYLARNLYNGIFDRGDTTLQVECLPQNNFLGNAVPLFTGCRTPLGNPNFNGYAWGGNSVLTLNPSTGTCNGIGWEFDVNNYYNDSKGKGILITGVGTKTCAQAIDIQRANLLSDWSVGVEISNYKKGIYIDGSTSVSPEFAIDLRGQNDNFIRITPADDLNQTSSIMYITNASATSAVFNITKNGGIRVGHNSPVAVSGVSIGRLDGISDWPRGIEIYKFSTGIVIDGTTSSSPSQGLFISNIPTLIDCELGTNGNNGILLKRATDTTPTGFFIRGVDTLSAVLFEVNTLGGLTAKNIDTAGHCIGSSYVQGGNIRATTSAGTSGTTLSIGNSTATTVGAAGGASALPATPLGYLIAYLGATLIKIPYYTA